MRLDWAREVGFPGIVLMMRETDSVGNRNCKGFHFLYTDIRSDKILKYLRNIFVRITQ